MVNCLYVFLWHGIVSARNTNCVFWGDKLNEEKYLMVAVDVLPDVFLRVLEAKELLASGEAKNVSRATKMVDVSRSAFYKYKDSIFRADVNSETVTITALLDDQTGALQSLLAAISAEGASIVTINQSVPESGTAKVAVAIHTKGMQIEPEVLCKKLKEQSAVNSIALTK